MHQAHFYCPEYILFRRTYTTREENTDYVRLGPESETDNWIPVDAVPRKIFEKCNAYKFNNLLVSYLEAVAS